MKTYELIPLPDITPEARQIAVAWIEGYQPMGFDIQQKHKLASDIMNYAAGQVAAERERIKKDLQIKVEKKLDECAQAACSYRTVTNQLL
jgi:hypothetical protein